MGIVPNVEEIAGKVREQIIATFSTAEAKEKIATAIAFAETKQNELKSYVDEKFGEMMESFEEGIYDLDSSLAFLAYASTASKFFITAEGKVTYDVERHQKAYKALVHSFNSLMQENEKNNASEGG